MLGIIEKVIFYTIFVYPNVVAKNEKSKNGIFFGKRMVSITVVYTWKDTLPYCKTFGKISFFYL